MAGRFCGFISDHIGREPAFTLGCSGVIVGLIMLLLIKDTSSVWMLYIYAICFGFFSGLNSPANASAVADIFEGKHFGAILGSTNLGYGLGNSLGAWVGGYTFDKFGSYDSAFVIAIMMMIIACSLLWISSPRKIRLAGSRGSKITFDVHQIVITGEFGVRNVSNHFLPGRYYDFSKSVLKKSYNLFYSTDNPIPLKSPNLP